ncbi:hypothetical protein [Taibaiella soli]|uniref:Uncharacterized protein n=1 Tax=Taibaiella soli TaxID=1649169 RepID=A0A2W2AT63_9BACT|nr:hypothetical protein [Taibaiella soli]PZF71154.1 hypothetical protein DN068_19455 [Taibaiella soli]
MSEQPDIINTDIISETTNAYWEDISPLVNGRAPKDTLVLTTPYDPGSPTESQMLKIMQACQLQSDQFNILSLSENQLVAWHQLRDYLKPKNVILFGITAEQLGIAIHFMPHQVNRFNDCSWIPTLTIEQLEMYPDIKKHFWNYGLKPVFIDKIYG